MRQSKMLRNLSLRLLSSSSLVLPFPIQSPFNQQLTSKLKTLLLLLGATSDDDHHASNYLTMLFLVHALDALVATQKLAHESISKSNFRDVDREAIECYLEDNVELLDACNGLVDKLDNIYKYVESLRLALHLLRGRFSPSSTAVGRANQLLESCQSMERERKKMTRSASGLKKLSNKVTQRMNSSARKNGYGGSETEDILDGSSIVTSALCEILDTTLSFKSKRGLRTTQMISRVTLSSYSWLSSLQELRNNVKETKQSVIWELQKTEWLTQELRQQLKSQDYSELGVTVEKLQRSSDELDEGLKPLEGKVKELYRYLMSVRMALLGKLSSMA